jgi:hypothetical protein
MSGISAHQADGGNPTASMSLQTSQKESLSPQARYALRNYRLGVASHTIGIVANDFIDAELILGGLLYAGTGSKMLVACLAIMNKLGILAPQLAAGSLLEHRPRKMPYYIGAAIVRGFGLASLVGSIFMLAHGFSAFALTIFMLSYLVVSVSGSVAYVVQTDMTGRMIPWDMLGSFLGLRNFGGQAAAILAGIFIIQPILGHGGRYSYFILAAAGSLLVMAAMGLVCMCRDHEHKTPRRASGLLISLRRGLRWLRNDANYRLFFWQRVMFRVEYLGIVFFIPYGKDVMMSGSTANVAILGGVMVAVVKASRMVASLLWSQAVDPSKCRLCLMSGGAFYALAAALALVAPFLPAVYSFEMPWSHLHMDFPMTVYLLALACLGLAGEGLNIGENLFLLTSAPPHRRLSYVAFINTVTSPLTLLPFLAAVVANLIGVRSLFFVVLASGLTSAWLAFRMTAVSRPSAASAGDVS